jgi:hypothetical protein
MRLLERTFDVPSPPAAAWGVLADVPSWPAWARHVRSVSLEPPGPLGPGSRGAFRLAGGIRSTFAVTEFEGGRSWTWAGPFLWLEVVYGHVLSPLPGGGTRVAFTIDGTGFGVGTLGRLFARIYARNLDRAIPLLRERMGGQG